MRFYFCLFLMVFSSCALAQKGVFKYKDWEIVCDNTLTCRAVGYNNKQQENDISLLLIRHAGKNQSFSGYIKLNYDEPEAIPISLSINNQSLGDLSWIEDEYYYELSLQQTEKIIQALKGDNNTVSFDSNDKKRVLSDAGFNAVMLKMDELQGRIGTTGAVINTGNQDESKVYSANKPPVIYKARVPNPEQSQNITFEEAIALFPELKQRYLHEVNLEPEVLESNCTAFEELTGEENDYTIFRDEFPSPRLIKLDDNYQLLEVLCDFTPRESNFAYWLIPNAIEPIDSNIKLITKMGDIYLDGTINAKPCIDLGRGGDGCMNVANWIWDGKQFSLEAKTEFSGQEFAGGAWFLPVFVSEVKTAER